MVYVGLITSTMNPAFLFSSLPDLRNILCRFLFSFFLMAISSSLLGQNVWPDAGSVREAMTRANNYWIANNSLGNAGWARAAYFTGNQRAALALTQSASERTYINWALSWGNANQWLIGPEINTGSAANAFCCGQTYIDIYRMDSQPLFITSMTNNVNTWVASSATNQLYWIDAFYMAGPTFARMGNLTGNTNYFQKLWQMYSYMKDGIGLFDPSSSLWYRDATFVYPKAMNAAGGKVFWSRGNGWVFAGLAEVLQQMSTNSPHYQDYVTMFQTMAPAIKAIQDPDGMWRASLYDTNQFPNPETSGTGFFTYGLAWGIRSGLLPATDYTNSVILAWNGLTNLALNVNGFVGWVQTVGSAPAATTATTTADFGVGAFLLACSEIELLATNGPALSPWAGADQTLVNTNPATPQSLTLDGSQTKIYRGPAGNYTWWEGANQIASGTNAQISLSPGQHIITLQVPGVDGITYTDSMTVTVITQSPPVLKLQFDFEDSGTTTTDSMAGVALNMVNSSGSPVDLHSGMGSGVGGYGKALDLSSGTMGGSGPMAFTTNNSTFSFGTTNAFTLTMWIKPASSLYTSTFPRFFSLGTNGTTDRGLNSVQILGNGQNEGTTSVQIFINSNQPSTSAFGAFTMPANQWSFLAMTYDGSTLNFYGGSETNPVALQSSTALSADSLNFGSHWTLMLGNDLAFNRSFKGLIDGVRFYTGAGALNDLEDFRSEAVPPLTIPISQSGNNLVFKVNTHTNALYILQAASTLAPPVAWTPILTNTGVGTYITNLVPLDTMTTTQQFFRYQIQ
jgi:unsaturated rhamnogalacturonyl hydrolase